MSSHVDAGRFVTYTNEELSGQCRMQARESLDPDYEAFMSAVADRLDQEPAAVRAECLAAIDYVQKNIVIPPSKRKRFDLRDLNIAFRNALTLAKEQITGENADKWVPMKEEEE